MIHTAGYQAAGKVALAMPHLRPPTYRGPGTDEPGARTGHGQSSN
jgi:hypothetical protein